MSVATVRQRMTHRALVQRTVRTPVDGYGDAPAPTWTTHIASQPCWLTVRDEGVEADRQRGTVVFESLRLLMPNGTDITERDRISGVTDRRGNVVYAGVLGIESVLPAHSHLELSVKQVGG